MAGQSDAERFRKKAQEARAMIAMVSSLEAKATLEDIAQDYERRAKQAVERLRSIE